MTPRSEPVTLEQRREGVMFFGEAMAAVLAEAKVTRLEWADPTVYLFLKNGVLSIHKADGTVSNLLVSDGDLAGADWVKV
jgi:hypothetical protein